MKSPLLYPVLLIVTCLPALHSAAQKKSILYHPFHSNLQSGRIAAFLEEINARSGVQVEYVSGSFSPDKIVSPGPDLVTLGALLQFLLSGEKVKVLEKNDKILLTPAPVPLARDALLPLYSFFGIVSEEGSREPLNDAAVWEPATRKGMLTNTHGYFSLLLPEGRHLLEITYAGYKSRFIELDLHWDLQSEVSLIHKEEFPEVIVLSGNGVKKTAQDKISPARYDAYDNFLGENDALRSLYILPGVMNVTDGANGILVRGGEQDATCSCWTAIPSSIPPICWGPCLS